MWLETYGTSIDLEKVDGIVWRKNTSDKTWRQMKKALADTTVYYQFVKDFEVALVFVSKNLVFLV